MRVLAGVVAAAGLLLFGHVHAETYDVVFFGGHVLDGSGSSAYRADVALKNKQGKTAAEVAELNKNAEAAQAIRVLSTAKAASAPAAPETERGTTSQ